MRGERHDLGSDERLTRLGTPGEREWTRGEERGEVEGGQGVEEDDLVCGVGVD